MVKGITYMWQKIPRFSFYRIQTNDSAVVWKLTRRKNSEPLGFSMNIYLWIVRMIRKSPIIVWRSLRRITCQKVEQDASGDGFIAYIRTNIYVFKRDQMVE